MTKDLIMNKSYEIFKDYQYDQFYRYPSTIKDFWIEMFISNINDANKSKEKKIFAADVKNTPIYFSLSTSNWDISHFGFKIGRLNNPFVHPEAKRNKLKRIISSILEYSKANGIIVLIARINGDNLNLIHELEEVGFRYYENIIWPVVDLDLRTLNKSDVRFLNKDFDDPSDLVKISSNYQYKRGHFHCDDKFNKVVVDKLYAKWVITSINNNKNICVISKDNRLVGYFICEIDERLSKYSGYKYGRLQSLALDGNYRGMGLGKTLFEGTLALLKEKGCRYVDSGYATKNHTSSHLHSLFGFSSAYEEVTLHLWL